MKQFEAVIETLEHLGGITTLGQLNQEVFKIKDCVWNTKTPFASIRRIVQERSEIYRVRPGLWALESHRRQLEKNGIVVEDSTNHTSKEVTEFTHSYYQGLLLQIGNMRRLHTFVPCQDRNKKCVNTSLGEICTESRMPQYTYAELVNRSSTIDAIWFDECSIGNGLLMPKSFFEVEHSTDIQNSLLKYCDLLGFSAGMFIVADRKRKVEFERKLSYSSFKPLKDGNKVKFLEYDRLVRIYEETVRMQEIGISI